MRYKYQLETTVGEFSWEYDLTHASDTLAKDHARRLAERSEIMRCHTVIALLIWDEEGKCIARFVLAPAQARNTLEGEGP